MPAVGVVIPTHGPGAYLAETVESVRAQSLADWILVIVCDGPGACVDTAERLAAADPRVRAVRQEHAGVAAARNRGRAALGAGPAMIAFLDHDDRWLPHTLERLAGALAAAPATVVGVHGVGRYIDAAGQPFHPGEMEMHQRLRHGVEGRHLVEWPRARPTGFANLAFSNCIPVGTILVRRTALDTVGLFDLRAVPADDYDMWLRLSRAGDLAFIDEVLMEYRRGTAPTWQRPRGGVPYVRRKILTAPENTTAQALLARRAYRLCEGWTVAHSLRELSRLAGERRFLPAARMLARAALHAAAYVRGAPIER